MRLGSSSCEPGVTRGDSTKRRCSAWVLSSSMSTSTCSSPRCSGHVCAVKQHHQRGNHKASDQQQCLHAAQCWCGATESGLL